MKVCTEPTSRKPRDVGHPITGIVHTSEIPRLENRETWGTPITGIVHTSEILRLEDRETWGTTITGIVLIRNPTSRKPRDVGHPSQTLQRLQKRQQGVLLGWFQLLEFLGNLLGLSAMAADGVVELYREAIMHEARAQAQSP